MNLYQINSQIQALIDSMEVDEETGEITGDIEEISKQLEGLAMEKHEALSYLAKSLMNLRSEEAALKAEENRLKARRGHIIGKQAKIIMILDRECHGEKTDLGVATVSYRRTTQVAIIDYSKAITALEDSGRDDCLRYKTPEIDKKKVKELIKSGTIVPGIEIQEGRSMSIK